ncbi:hypothetical protein V1L54_26300 [Streptomyces sp. TRM 70361]|uniref:hypothetical protein n=1 Tax=Streptomyces sp. TRM 70361 TaxID=3116553 RepID=UPI002E7AED74|nr:hypothetical protein [Streptomyces sp. TRM 70361]MEE1942881.1 hypothetical protein [Streptomyces sp. TRM 70361]
MNETPPQRWLRDHALLALRINRHMAGAATGTVLVYRGPRKWSEQVAAEAPVPPGRLAEDAEALLAGLHGTDGGPVTPGRVRYLSAQVRAMRAVARQLAGRELPLPEYARACLGVPVERLPEELFEEAHSRLDAALPRGTGSLHERLESWKTAHSLPPEELADRLPPLVGRAVAETRRRTGAIVPLPEGEEVRCRIVPGALFRGAGDHEGGLRSTLYIGGGRPFNLADLLYVVAHEGHPGHIAESLLKERVLVEERGLLDQRVRFMLAPAFVISEGLGLHAQEIVFPGDEAQRWLTDHVLAAQGTASDGSDFAAIHRVQNLLFGVWANAALLAAEGRPGHEVAAYLSRWALLSDAETAAAMGSLKATGMALYIFAYFHGWRLLDSWLAVPDRSARVRRLLTEQLLPSDLTAAAGPEDRKSREKPGVRADE